MSKRKFILLFAVVALTALLSLGYSAYTGSSLSENGRIDSKILHETMHYSVYLPPGYHGYGNGEKRYPVLYLLHGASGDHTVYPRKIGIGTIADRSIQNEKCVPMIIVMPRSHGGVYANLGRGAYSYEDYFFQELMPRIEKTYRATNNKEHRAIAGHSMGGQGALLYALKHPDIFATCAAVGAAFELEELETDGMAGENDLNALIQKAAMLQSENALNVRFYIDCGKDDGLCKVNERLHHMMTELGVPHEYYVGKGGHTWEYWREAMPKVLRFVSETFSD